MTGKCNHCNWEIRIIEKEISPNEGQMVCIDCGKIMDFYDYIHSGSNNP